MQALAKRHTNMFRIMPYGVTVGALTIIFIFIAEIMLAQRNLDPSYIMLGSFILFVLYLAGLIETAIEVFSGAVSTLP